MLLLHHIRLRAAVNLQPSAPACDDFAALPQRKRFRLLKSRLANTSRCRVTLVDELYMLLP